MCSLKMDSDQFSVKILDIAEGTIHFFSYGTRNLVDNCMHTTKSFFFGMERGQSPDF